MTTQEHSVWLEDQTIAKRHVAMKEKHFGKQGFIDNVITLAIINWVLESVFIKD